MSGHKRTTITLNRDEVRRLQEASRRLSAVEHDFHKIQEQISQLRNQNFSQAYQELESRQQVFNNSLDGVTAQLAAIEVHTSHAVVNHAASLQEEISRMGTDVWENTQALLDEHARSLENALSEGHHARQTQFNQLHQSLSQIKRGEQDKASYAEQALKEADLFLESLIELYGAEQSAEEGLHNSGQQLNQAVGNLHAGFSEAALLTAQQVFDNLARLRLQVEAHIMQQQVFRQSLQEKIARVDETLRANQNVRAVNPQGEPLESVIDVDYWSRGGWRSLRKRLHQIRESFSTSMDLEVDEGRLIFERLEQIEQEIPQVVFDARLAVISSQVRFNIAEFVVAALQEQGYALETSAYDQDDMRSTYLIQLGNFEGSQVFVNLSPHPEDPIAHDLDIAFQDPDLRTEHEMRHRSSELSTSLHAFGLQMNGLQSLPESKSKITPPRNRHPRLVRDTKHHYGTN